MQLPICRSLLTTSHGARRACWWGADVLRGMRTQMSDITTAVIALLAVAFAITLGVLLTDLWPWVRKRPDVAKGSDDERRST